MKVVKGASRQWYQGTVSIADGGTGATTVAQALANLGYIPAGSLGQPNGTVPLVGGVIPKEYLGLSDTGPVAVMGNTRMMAGSQRTLSITNFDSFGTYVIAAKYGTVGTLSVAGATAGDFLYTAPATKPAEGKDTITINGIAYDVEIIGSAIAKPSIVSPVENFAGEVSSVGTITSTAYNAGSTTIIDSITIGGAGSFITPSGTEKIRVVNRSQVSVVVSQAGTTKTIPANSEMEWAGTGTWLYSVIVGRVLVEFLKGTSAHASSDWQIATDLAFGNVIKQSVNDTTNKVSWPSQITESGVYYLRVRHRDATGAVSDWSDARRIAPIKTPTQSRNTTWTTNWSSSWLTNWDTNYAQLARSTTAQTFENVWHSAWVVKRTTLYEKNTEFTTSWGDTDGNGYFWVYRRQTYVAQGWFITSWLVDDYRGTPEWATAYRGWGTTWSTEETPVWRNTQYLTSVAMSRATSDSTVF